MEESLAVVEKQIFDLEEKYNDTPSGNLMRGFDGFRLAYGCWARSGAWIQKIDGSRIRRGRSGTLAAAAPTVLFSFKLPANSSLLASAGPKPFDAWTDGRI